MSGVGLGIYVGVTEGVLEGVGVFVASAVVGVFVGATVGVNVAVIITVGVGSASTGFLPQAESEIIATNKKIINSLVFFIAVLKYNESYPIR